MVNCRPAPSDASIGDEEEWGTEPDLTSQEDADACVDAALEPQTCDSCGGSGMDSSVDDEGYQAPCGACGGSGVRG